MNELKDFIQQNKNSFDDEPLPVGHRERFAGKLKKQNKKGPLKRRFVLWGGAIAASIAILFMAIFWHESEYLTRRQNIIQPSEFRVTNEYYKNQMEQQIAEIMCKLSSADPETQAQLMAEVERMKQSNELFIKDIEKGEDENLAIFYLVKHYRVNIEVLESINEKLGRYNNC